MIRLAFNSGEVDEEVSLRMDVDAMSRACLTLENWHVSDMGGIRRRRGFRKFADGERESVLIPFIYTYAESEGMRFLVEVRRKEVNVWGLDGERVAHFESSNKYVLQFDFTPGGIRYKQINKLLILTSLDQKPWVIKRNDDALWEMEPYEFKNPPWRNTGTREEHIKLKNSNGTYTVEFSDEVDKEERTVYPYDRLRLSYWTEQEETRASAESLCNGVETITSAPATAKAGDKFAVRSEDVITYWVCKKEFKKADVYCPGLDDPGSYPDNFIKAENTNGFESVDPILSVNDLPTTCAKNTKIAIRSGYWEYYTCIKDFPGGTGLISDYPAYFIRGLAVGGALRCKGAWSFFCSGLWYGSYEVRRNYDTPNLSADWEARGISFSQVASASNVQITGTEEHEECYLRLFITRSRYMGNTIKSGFPPDGCDNKLIVESYKHNEVLEAHVADDVRIWENITPIPGKMVSERDINDWSWCSFSPRYGFPLLCDVYAQRLVFASTPAQPQTLWFSCVDDLTNFELGNNADNALELTINDTSQNPMCWCQSQNNRFLVGTSEAEWIISEGQSGFSAGSAKVTDQGHIGSNGVASLSTSDKVLYIERGGGRVYEYGYNYETDGYQSKDLTQLAPHIAREHGGIIGCSFMRKPTSVAVFVLGDGQLALCTYNKSQQVNAWGRWVTDGKILNIAVLPNGNKQDLLFALVEREEGVFIELHDPEENDYTDSGKDYESVIVTNALYNPLESRTSKGVSTSVQVKLGQDVPLLDDDGENESGAVQISGDGEYWEDIDRGGTELKKGWDDWIPPAGIKWEPRVGIKVKGKRGFSLYCIQR